MCGHFLVDTPEDQRASVLSRGISESEQKYAFAKTSAVSTLPAITSLHHVDAGKSLTVEDFTHLVRTKTISTNSKTNSTYPRSSPTTTSSISQY
jgi:hypothetical protein